MRVHVVFRLTVFDTLPVHDRISPARTVGPSELTPFEWNRKTGCRTRNKTKCNQ